MATPPRARATAPSGAVTALPGLPLAEPLPAAPCTGLFSPTGSPGAPAPVPAAPRRVRRYPPTITHKATTMGLKAIKFGTTSDLHLRHPVSDAPLFNDDGTPMIITLAGEHSEDYKAVTRRWQNDMLRRPNRKLNADQVEERSLDLLVAVTKGWAIQWEEGQMLPFSPQAARELYADREHAWIKQQVEQHVYEASNFLGESLRA